MIGFATRRRVIVAASVGLAALGFAVQSCGSDGSSFGDGPCSTVYKDQCGQPCSGDTACPSGLYCNGGLCRADCVAGDSTCLPPTACDLHGRCTSLGPGFGEGGTNPSEGGGGGGDACIDLAVDLSKIVPTVVLLVDQSSSMTADFGGNGQRWDVVRDVLMNADGGIVTRLEGEIVFGLSFFARAGGFPQDASTCPRLISQAPAPNDYDALAALYVDAGPPVGGTPTGESIDKLIGRVNGIIVNGGFATQQTPGPKIIVLATDGEPDICADGDNEDAGRKLALSAAEAAYDAGIRTYVIGVGSQIGATRLKEMANAGSGQPVDTGDAAPFSANNRDQFVAAMNQIAFNVRTCTFLLNGTVAAGDESKGTVTLDGKPLVYNDPNGWKLDNPSQLEILGTSCDAIKSTGGQLAVHFPCGTFVETPTK